MTEPKSQDEQDDKNIGVPGDDYHATVQKNYPGLRRWIDFQRSEMYMYLYVFDLDVSESEAVMVFTLGRWEWGLVASMPLRHGILFPGFTLPEYITAVQTGTFPPGYKVMYHPESEPAP